MKNLLQLVKARTFINKAAAMIQDCESIDAVMLYVSGNCESQLDDHSPFEIHGFASSLCYMLEGSLNHPELVERFTNALSFDGKFFYFDTRVIQVELTSGLRFTSPVWSVVTSGENNDRLNGWLNLSVMNDKFNRVASFTLNSIRQFKIN